ANDSRVDFIERPLLRRFGVTGGRASTQPNDRNLRRGALFLETIEYFSQRPAPMIIGERLTLPAGVNKLLAMQRVAMHEIMQRAFPADRDARNSKKVPLHMQGCSVRTEIEQAADQHA